MNEERYAVLVCGGRDFNQIHWLYEVLDGLDKRPTEIIEGGATGADRLARTWGTSRGIKVRVFEAKWGLYGRAAGVKRNTQMIVEGNATPTLRLVGALFTVGSVCFLTSTIIQIRKSDDA